MDVTPRCSYFRNLMWGDSLGDPTVTTDDLISGKQRETRLQVVMAACWQKQGGTLLALRMHVEGPHATGCRCLWERGRGKARKQPP